MVSAYPPGVTYRPHKDWYSNEPYNDRELTIMLYVQPADWSPDEDGGDLALRGTGPEPGPVVASVPPLMGRMVLFWSRSVWHEVMPPKRRPRFALTLWVDRRGDEHCGGADATVSHSVTRPAPCYDKE